jgi:PAS domain S-box-containing protein
MNSPDRKKPPAAELDAQAADSAATAFFPNFATVRSVLEAAQIGIWSWDIATNTVTWSSNLEAIHHLPDGTFDGTYASFQRDIRREDLPKVEASIKEALRAHSAYRTRYRLIQRDRVEDCWLESSGTVAVKDGVAERMLGLCHDITERVNLEAELRSRVKQQEALAQLGERALVEPDLERLLKDAVSTVAVTLSVDFVKVLELLPGFNRTRHVRPLHAGFPLAAGHRRFLRRVEVQARGLSAPARLHERR